MEPLYTVVYSDGEFVRFHAGSGEAWVLTRSDEEDDEERVWWKKVEEGK